MDRSRLPQPWSPPQRGVLVVLCAGLLIYLSVRLWLHPAYVPRPMPDEAPRAAELAGRVDPNTADWPELAALPMLGEKRARQIVGYREQLKERSLQRLPFGSPRDLEQVPGIGPTIAEMLSPHLVFPADDFRQRTE